MDVLQAIAILREQGLIPEQEANRMIRRARAEEVRAAAAAAAAAVLPEGWVLVDVVVEDPDGRVFTSRSPRPARPRERVSVEEVEGEHSQLAEFARQYAEAHGIKWYGLAALKKTKRFREAARQAGFDV